MPIPSSPELMRPVSAAHVDGAAVRLEQLAARVAPEVGVSEEERNERQPSGDFVFTQRVGWARAYLEQLGYVERPTRGETRITDAGRRVLDSDESIAPPPADWATKPVSREAVLEAIEKFRTGDRDEVLREHGFGRALDYVVEHEGETHDRPGTANDGTSKSYFGSGRIASVSSDEREDGLEHFVATIEDFEPFAHPVPFAEGPKPRNAQTSISQISKVQFEKLLSTSRSSASSPTSRPPSPGDAILANKAGNRAGRVRHLATPAGKGAGRCRPLSLSNARGRTRWTLSTAVS